MIERLATILESDIGLLLLGLATIALICGGIR